VALIFAQLGRILRDKIFLMYIDDKELEDLIIRSGFALKADFEEVKTLAKERSLTLGTAALMKGIMSEDDLRRMEAHILGLPFVDLQDRRIPFEILSLIPEPVCREHNVIAFAREREGIAVAFLDPRTIRSFEALSNGQKIVPRLTDTHSMRAALLAYQSVLKQKFGDLIQEDAKKLGLSGEGGVSKNLSTKAAAVRIVDSIIKHALLQEASDIHLEPGENMLLVRYRIKGALRDAMVLPKNATLAVFSRLKMLAHLEVENKNRPQDGRFKAEIEGENLSLRVSTMPVALGERMLIRLSRQNTEGFTLESLGFHGEGLERIHEALRKKEGLVLVTGPKGSGKTTTLYTILDILNTPTLSLAAAEEKIEYRLARLSQVLAKPKIGLTLAAAIRALMRQDPDVIMVGNLPDKETASAALNAALTGKLVIASLEADSAAEAIKRLLKMKVDESMLALSLKLVVSQRLARRAMSPGLVGIAEVMPVGIHLKDLIREGAPASKIEEEAVRRGFLALREEARLKTEEGLISPEEAKTIIR